jgi:DNA-directed RNA polymerase subunit E'/Rpb7
MSTATKAALDAAVAAHIADKTDGDVLTDYALVIASTSMEDIGTGATSYLFEANGNQPAHVSFGLLSYAMHSSVWLSDDDDE